MLDEKAWLSFIPQVFCLDQVRTVGGPVRFLRTKPTLVFIHLALCTVILELETDLLPGTQFL